MHSYDLDSRQKVLIPIASPQDRFYLRLTFTAKQERCPDLKLLIVWRSFVQNKHLEVRHKRQGISVRKLQIKAFALHKVLIHDSCIGDHLYRLVYSLDLVMQLTFWLQPLQDCAVNNINYWCTLLNAFIIPKDKSCESFRTINYHPALQVFLR